ncbi:hypothetical protein Dacet_1457 [Denitrovibrio acetiphilus DSM 12809]|uniref:Uncharacterized protein n=1 Tax=Denitrovibrio acetiphilus (strain DSM 12809 / NBRC 114555 / N2460) TaxID=522772 RepID=D4H878_DENA2|nr:hypothetical protein Dacet_1457 [Denitrovibrio acetiphilus DSM 12809]
MLTSRRLKTEKRVNLRVAKAKVKLQDPSHYIMDSVRILNEKGVKSGSAYILGTCLLFPLILKFFQDMGSDTK